MGMSGADIDVDSAVIAAQTATIQAGYVAESGATLVEFATAEETISAVQNGEADAVLADGDIFHLSSQSQTVNLRMSVKYLSVVGLEWVSVSLMVS